MLLNHGVALCGSKTSEREHTNLCGNMIPSTLSSNLFELSSQKLSHGSDSIGHSDELIKPLLAHGWFIEDDRGDSGTVPWWGRVVDSDDNLELGEDFTSDILIGADKVKSSASLTVETHDFSEGLSDNHLETLVEEISEADTILVEVTSDETLISGIEEWIKLSLLADGSDLLPLGESWVNTSGVVSAGVEEDSRSWSGIFEVSDHAVEVETLGFLVEVSILSDLEASSAENFVVVSPSWVANVNWGWSELAEEITNDSQGTGSRQGLGGGDSSACDVWVVPSEEDASGTLVEGLVTIDWGVLLVKSVIIGDSLLGLSHYWEYVWLSVLRSVGTDTQVNLSWVFVVFESKR